MAKQKKSNKKKKTSADTLTFSDKEIRLRRSFPARNAVLLAIIVALQAGLALFAMLWMSVSPKDIINRYEITAEPQTDGTLMLDYSFSWTALDKYEALSWVDIGMANHSYIVDEGSLSENIATYSKITQDNGYCALRIFFDTEYKGGENFDFAFSVKQADVLCADNLGYFYELVPGWFNEIEVEDFSFRWKWSDGITSDYLIPDEDGYISRRCRLTYGDYIKMTVAYEKDAFSENVSTVPYSPFDPSGAYNGLESELEGNRFAIFAIIGLLFMGEVYIADSFISYVRGRGFIMQNGRHIHLYGAANTYGGTGSRGYSVYRGGRGSSGRSSGCACACACACAGGGRAGCSAKDISTILE